MREFLVHFRGVRIWVKGEYTPPEPASECGPEVAESFELSGVSVGGFEILPLLGEDIQEELCQQILGEEKP